ncbi:lipoate--protein ligase family protein [Candidatus Woesearchaeota archaeon]|nr:lipoate--protein ligase family protein [Candidatus Woesearchaeota archaeon]
MNGSKLCVVDSSRPAAENLAINEACFEAVRDGVHEEIVRLYFFSRPGMILSKHQDVSDVRESAFGKVDVTRRFSSGSAVYVDEHTLGYSLFGRLEHDATEEVPTHIPYKRMRSCVMDVLQSFGLSAKEERHWGVRVDGGVVAGHAQRYGNKTYEVHGLLRLKGWDMDILDRVLRLRKKAQYDGQSWIIVDGKAYDASGAPAYLKNGARIVRNEYDELQQAPSLLDKGIAITDLVDRLGTGLSGSRERHSLPESIRLRAVELCKLFSSGEHVHNKDYCLKRNLGHCFVDFEGQNDRC